MKGKLIYIEGPDGSGKTTQRDLLAAMLTAEGFAVHCAHEPGGGFGAPIREMIFSKELGDLPRNRRRLAEYCLFLADRVVHAEKLRAFLGEGRIVLSDRGPWSSVAYQGYGEGLDIERIINSNTEAMGGVVEDLVIVLDGDYEELKKRRRARTIGNNRFDEKPESYHRSVQQGFLILARQRNWSVVNGVGEREDITKALREIIRERLSI